jgi:hypothetical protein
LSEFYAALPEEIQKLADENFKLLEADLMLEHPLGRIGDWASLPRSHERGPVEAERSCDWSNRLNSLRPT